MIGIRRTNKQNQKLKAQLLLGFLVLWTGCSAPREIINFTGNTMGTTFAIKIISSKSFNSYKKLEIGIDSILEKVNQQMSIWDPNSEISKFNRNKSIDPISVSSQLYEVVERANMDKILKEQKFQISQYQLLFCFPQDSNPILR